MRAVLACALLAGACADLEPDAGPAPSDFEAWKAQLPAGFAAGTHLVEGDIELGDDELYDYWAYHAEGRPTDLWLVSGDAPSTWSVVHQQLGEDVVYAAPRKIDLTYCTPTSSYPVGYGPIP